MYSECLFVIILDRVRFMTADQSIYELPRRYGPLVFLDPVFCLLSIWCLEFCIA